MALSIVRPPNGERGAAAEAPPAAIRIAILDKKKERTNSK